MIRSSNERLFWFHANLLALVTETLAADWVEFAILTFDEADFGPPFERLHGRDVFAAYQLTHSSGRLAQIEYDQEDYIFVDCGEVHWSAPLEEEIVIQAERQSQSHGCYVKNSVNITMEQAFA